MNFRRNIVFGAFTSYLFASSVAGSVVSGPKLPFAFVENKGQSDREIRYIGNGPEFKAWFRAGGVTFQQGAAVASVQFVNGDPHARIEALAPTGATANYLRGSDPGEWQTGLPLFGLLRYRGVWPGVEIRFKADTAGTKAEYVVAPGASIAGIRLRFDGRAEIRNDGSLTVFGESGRFREDKPVLFEGEGSERKEIAGSFRKFGDGTIGFAVPDYDSAKPLTIDPTIVFSGYFGNSETTITAVAVNSYYNTIVAGWTIATDLPAAGRVQPANQGGVDAFVAAFSPAGGALIYCTYLGGSGDDRALGIAVDASNNTYVTGWTSSANFPVLNAFQKKLSGTRDAFVTKLSPLGGSLIYSTYLGGSGVDVGTAIALDSSNAPVIVGYTTSTNLATTPGVFQSRFGGNQDAFVAKLTTSGAALTFLTYFGGSGVDSANAVKLDSTGSVYFGGSTFSMNFPTVSASQPHSGGGQDGFVARLSASGASAIFSTYFGGSGGTVGAPEEVNALALASGGTIIVAGTTSSLNLPSFATSLQPNFGGGLTDGFVARFSAAGALSKCTYLGGSGDDGINAIAMDWDGYIYVAGFTTSTDFPVQAPIQTANGGGMDAFVAKILIPQIIFATYLGGSGNDSANAIAIDSMTAISVAGSTGSGNFPVAGAVSQWPGSVLSSFVARLIPNFTLNIFASPIFYYDVWHDTGYNGPNITLNTSSFGLAGDIPVAGDWTGSGVKRIGVFRSGTWLLDIDGDGVLDAGDKTVQFGQAGDLPVLGDWNGTGQIKLGLFRQGAFILDLSGHLSGIATGLSDATFLFGLARDLPVAADWNQSGTTKVGVFRDGLWIVDYTGDRVSNGLNQTYTFGQAGDLPVIGDWASTGLRHIGVYRQGIWILDYVGANAISPGSSLYLAFGGAGYVPVVQ